jgi:putative transposase
VLYARVFPADQKADLCREVFRLAAFAAERGLRLAKVVAEIGSGRNIATRDGWRCYPRPSKAALCVARLHRRVRNRRRDFHHKLSTTLTRTKSVVVIKDLAGKGMVCSRPLARAISDAGWGELRRMLEYKARWYGCRIATDRFYPSSKTCYRCKAVREDLSLSERIFRCEACGLEIGRDWNAAILLEHLASGRNAPAPGVPRRRSSRRRKTSSRGRRR